MHLCRLFKKSFIDLACFKKTNQVYFAKDQVSELLNESEVSVIVPKKTQSSIDPEQPKKKLKFDLDAILENNMESIVEVNLTAVDELNKFLNEGRSLKIHEDVFQWWESNKLVYPRLYKLAKRVLIVPATSADSERVFSTAGYILNFKRSRLSGAHANMLIFLNKNQ